MLIVITRDKDIMNWVESSKSGSENWIRVKQLSAGTQREVTQQMVQLLKLVKTEEPLCITGHGNDTEVGDEGSDPADWTWSNDQLAQLFGGLVDGYEGPVLMEVCADSVTDFATNLVLSLEKIKKLNGIWVYGYNKSISAYHPFPSPDKLDKNVELYAKQVKY